jgi:hypothetical protein
MIAFDPKRRRDENLSVPGHRRLSRREFFLTGIGGAVGLTGPSTAVYAAAVEPERLITTSYRLTPPGGTRAVSVWWQLPTSMPAAQTWHSGISAA